MTAPRYAELAGKLFARETRASIPPPDPWARSQAISAIAGAIGARARRRRIERWSAGFAAAAALAATSLGVAHHAARREIRAIAPPAVEQVHIVARSVSGAASVISAGAQAPLAEESAVPQGSRLVTPANGRATLAFSTGTSVLVGEGADMTLGGDGSSQILRLSAGWIDLHVAKLSANQKFVVGTADSEVEVRGTQFHVSIVRPDPSCGGGTPTRVVVTEGVVVVRHEGTEDRIAAGEVWPRGCARAAGLASAGDGHRAAAQAGAGGNLGQPSTLREQNALFEEAIAAKNKGDVRAALASFDRFLVKYPASPLAEGASAETMGLLVKVSPSRAGAAARQYVAAYPKGAHRAEAETILSEAP